MGSSGQGGPGGPPDPPPPRGVGSPAPVRGEDEALACTDEGAPSVVAAIWLLA
jgi:hypothetical protein